VPDPVVLTDASLREAAATLVHRAEAATTFEAALHAVAQVLRGELGARQVSVSELAGVDATHARLIDLIEPQPGFRAVPRRVRLDGTLLGQALRSQREAGVPPAAIVLPVPAGAQVVAVIELTGIDVPVDPEALARLLELARTTLAKCAQDAAPCLPCPGAHVLLVEDNVAHHDGMADLLGRSGCRVTSTSGMLGACDALARTQFDLVFVDTRLLRESDGSDLNRLRRALGGGSGTACEVPVIAITGSAVPGDGQRLRESGFDDHVSKPFHPDQVLSVLKRGLRPHAPAESQESVASGHAAASPVLDAAALARLTELDPTGENHLLERVLQAFQTSVARLRPQADTAREKGDRAGVRLVAHTLKSSSASIGALHLSQLCAQIETTIRLESGDDLEAQLDALGKSLDDVLQAIAQLLKERA
jgi:CheY-like chemotaxis protein